MGQFTTALMSIGKIAGLILFAGSSVVAENTKINVSVVGPNVISTSAQEFGATATADGKTLYYTYSNSAYTYMTLMTSTSNEGIWSEPEVLSFSGIWNDADPSLSPDGKRLYFISNRPVNGKMTGFLEIWYSELDGNSWGSPVPVITLLQDKGYKTYPSIANDGTLYFAISGKVYLSRLKNGEHQAKEAIGVNSSSVAIAPDQSFMVLHHKAKGKKANLGISFFGDGEWSEPVMLPKPINSSASESSPNLASDGKTLYFTSTRMDWSQIHWPRAKKIANFAQAKNELQHTWQNGLRNIYRVDLTSSLKASIASR